MYAYQIREMVDALKDAGVLSEGCSKSAIDTLHAYWRNSIASTWSIEDVQTLDPDLTDEQAREILYDVQHKKDASIGINWDVIQARIDEYKEDANERSSNSTSR